MTLTRGHMAIFALLSALLVLSGSFGGYQLGLQQGKKEGREIGKTRALFALKLNTCVYLSLAMSNAQSGHPEEAERIRNLLFFSAVLELQEALDSGEAGRAGVDRADAERVLKGASEIFWRDPSSIDILDGDTARRPLKPKLQAVFDRYKP